MDSFVRLTQTSKNINYVKIPDYNWNIYMCSAYTVTLMTKSDTVSNLYRFFVSVIFWESTDAHTKKITWKNMPDKSRKKQTNFCTWLQIKQFTQAKSVLTHKKRPLWVSIETLQRHIIPSLVQNNQTTCGNHLISDLNCLSIHHITSPQMWNPVKVKKLWNCYNSIEVDVLQNDVCFHFKT